MASSRHGLYSGVFVCNYRLSLSFCLCCLLILHAQELGFRPDTLQYPIPFKTINQLHVSACVTTRAAPKVNDMIPLARHT
jgi:hypothetical protein